MLDFPNKVFITQLYINYLLCLIDAKNISTINDFIFKI